MPRVPSAQDAGLGNVQARPGPQAPSAGQNIQSNPDQFGARQANDLQRLGNVANEAAQRSLEITERVMTREDTIARLRQSEAFYNEAFEAYNKASTELDLVDPQTSRTFNQKLRETATKYIQRHGGSPESRLKLEAQVRDIESTFARQMTKNSLSAQRKFLLSKADEQINHLSAMARENPGEWGNIYKELDNMVADLSPAMYPEDEIALVDAAQSEIAYNAITSYVDGGRYEEARDLINENPFFMQALSPDRQRSVLKEIETGLRDQERETQQIYNKINAIRTAAEELDVDIPGTKIFSAITGISQDQTPAQKLQEFSTLANLPEDRLTPSIIAKIGYGVDLPSESQVDFNKEFTPNGDLTPKGISAKVKAPFDRAAAAKTYKDKLDGAINLFREDGNSQALLSAMITFQKALDDGAVVREGDIVLQRSAQNLSDRIGLILKQAETGQVVGNTLVDQMQVTMSDFVKTALKSEKAQIDPLLDEADRLGYRRVNIIPRESYSSVFGGIIDTSGGTGSGDQSAPLSIRNNNPGNLRPTGQQTGFRRFETPQEGVIALKEDLSAKIGGSSSAMKGKYGEGYEPTVKNLISAYAPPSENDTGAYVGFVADKLGVDENYVLKPEDIDRLVPAIIEFEGGKKAVSYFNAGDQEKKRTVYRLSLDGKVIGSN